MDGGPGPLCSRVHTSAEKIVSVPLAHPIMVQRWYNDAERSIKGRRGDTYIGATLTIYHAVIITLQLIPCQWYGKNEEVT